MAEKTLYQKYKEQSKRISASAKKAMEWFNTKVKKVSDGENEDNSKLLIKGQLGARVVGRLIMFYYDPKTKDKLPYYDRFPLVFILKINSDGFLGLNLHYLPVALRARLLDGIMTILKKKHLNPNKKLNMSYDIIKGSSRTRFFKPCVKRYLNTHVRSKFYVVDPEEWEFVITLPTERFEKADKKRVWQESRRKLGV